MAKRSEEGDNADDDQHGDMSRPLLQSAPNTIPEARPPSPSALPHYSSSSSPTSELDAEKPLQSMALRLHIRRLERRSEQYRH